MELLDIVNEQGLPTGETVERSEAHRLGIPHRTSHVWLFRRREGKTELLLQQRCRSKDSFPGCFDISSAGHIPAGQDFAESALRELEEELGVTAQAEELILCGDRTIVTDDVFFAKPYHDRQYSRVFCLERDLDADAFRLQAEEVEAVRWMELEACMEAVRSGSIPNCIFPGELEMVKKHLPD